MTIETMNAATEVIGTLDSVNDKVRKVRQNLDAAMNRGAPIDLAEVTLMLETACAEFDAVLDAGEMG